MLRITNLQFLYKSQGVFDMLLSSKSRIKLSVNQQYDYVDLEENTSNAKIVWNTDSLPAIQLPTFNNQNSFTFELYKDNTYLGKTRSFVKFGRDKKDCLDILNKDFHIIGKLLYEAKWSPVLYQQKMITLQQYYAEGKGTSKPNPYSTLGIQAQQNQESAMKNQESAKDNKHRQRAISAYDERIQQAMGCFGCFMSKRKKSTLDYGHSKKSDNQQIYEGNQQIYDLTPVYYSQNPYQTKPNHQ